MNLNEVPTNQLLQSVTAEENRFILCEILPFLRLAACWRLPHLPWFQGQS